MDRWFTLVLAILGVWRVTHLLHAEDGPWDVVVRLRRVMGTGVVGRGMDCFDCLSLWIAAPLAWVVETTWLDRALLWPALSAGAMVLNRVVSRLEPTRAAYFEEDSSEEPSDVQLRTETRQPVQVE
jgi:hypothetical protein